MMTSTGIRVRVVAAMLLAALATACGDRIASPAVNANIAAVAPLSPLALLGERAYHERLLSASGRMSCASCHDPAFFHGPPNGNPVQVGGALLTAFGVRAAPSLRYLERQPLFDHETLHGGLMADGRAGTLEAQARLPLFNALEYDLDSAAELVRRLRLTVWAPQFVAHFGASSDNERIVAQLTEALAAFIREDPRFHPYDSKFDHVAAGREQFSAAESRGRDVFRDPLRGNCAACHPDVAGDGRPPLFTDFRYFAQGVPRNAGIPVNGDPRYFDLGLCGPQRKDLAKRRETCGMFRTPGLRNVARRPVFFHNGSLRSLAEVVDFYNSRDADPARWYPAFNGVVQRFNDLPESMHANVIQAAPFGERPGGRPPMSVREAADLVCFLETLTDGYVPGSLPQEDCQR